MGWAHPGPPVSQSSTQQMQNDSALISENKSLRAQLAYWKEFSATLASKLSLSGNVLGSARLIATDADATALALELNRSAHPGLAHQNRERRG